MSRKQWQVVDVDKKKDEETKIKKEKANSGFLPSL